MTIIFDALFMIMLCIISYKDYKEHHIHDNHIIICLFILFCRGIYTGCLSDTFYGFLVGGIIGALCYGLGFLITRSESFGLGDSLLLSVIGSYLGLADIINYFIFACYFNGLILLPKIIFYKKYKFTGYPAAPFYSLGLISFLVLNRPTLLTISEFIFKSWL